MAIYAKKYVFIVKYAFIAKYAFICSIKLMLSCLESPKKQRKS